MSMHEDLYIVGSAWTSITSEIDQQLDELVFDACVRALADAGVMRHQIGFSVTSSLDLYDARSISSALTAPAAAGYLTDELRVEGDSGSALLLAASALASGATDFAVVVAIHVPEVGSTDEASIRRLDEHVSSYTFDSHLERPVGMTSCTTLGLHAGHRVSAGVVDVDSMSRATSDEIARGAHREGARAAVSAADVAAAPLAMAPLTELMLPAASAGVGVLVLGAGVLGRRCRNVRGRIAGWGKATAPSASNPAWLLDPCKAASIAAADAYERARLTDMSAVDVLEMTDLSPALTGELLAALSLSGMDAKQVNPSGGVRSSYPGIANGVLRVMQGLEGMDQVAGARRAVVHTTDDLMGLVSATSTVLVLEAS